MQKQTAIYVRRSVSDKDKGNNSLSIDSQKAECIKFLNEGETYRIYCDDGKSGKNIEGRPAFQQMMSDAKNGLIERIVVKKYDRFSRNMREYLNVTNTLDGYGVSVFSLTEPFNTATKEGRMMRNNLLNFAEFERETIAARVTDAYNTRAQETGFYQGGKIYYGYQSERKTINGKTGSVLVPSKQSEYLIKMYELYKSPNCSLSDVLNYFKKSDIDINSNEKMNTDRSKLSQLLKSPLYVKADKEVYQFLISKSFEIIDDVEAFDGIHGLFRHSRKGESDYIKVGYHEGLVDSETWLAVQDKKSHNQKYSTNRNPTNTWLTGIVKCAHCGYSPAIAYGWNVGKTKQWRYFRDTGMYRAKGCIKKFWKIKPDEVENIVFEAMKKRINALEIAKKESKKPNADVDNLKAEVIKIEDEIRKLLDKLAEADSVLFDYIQDRIKSLHEKKSSLEEKIRNKARKQKIVDTAPLSDPLRSWETLTIIQKHDLAAEMIEVIYVSDEKGVEIKFSL